MHYLAFIEAINTTSQGLKTLLQAFELALRDLALLLPKLLVALVIIALYIVVIIFINKMLRKILSIFKIDELLKPILQEAYISLTGLIIVLTDIGLVLLAVYSVLLIVFPQEIIMANILLGYLARYASIVFIIILSFIVLGSLVRFIRMEAKLRGFMFLLLLLVTMLVTIDITALSDTVKNALSWGISLGIASLITVFAAWYFFHDIIEKRLKNNRRDSDKNSKPSEHG